MFNIKLKKRPGQDLGQLSFYLVCVAIILAAAYLAYPIIMDAINDYVTDRDMDTIANACVLYQSQSSTFSLPANLGQLISGLSAAQSKDGLAHSNYVNKPIWTTDSSTFVDAWGNPFTYNAAARTITSTNNGNTPKVRQF